MLFVCCAVQPALSEADGKARPRDIRHHVIFDHATYAQIQNQVVCRPVRFLRPHASGVMSPDQKRPARNNRRTTFGGALGSPPPAAHVAAGTAIGPAPPFAAALAEAQFGVSSSSGATQDSRRYRLLALKDTTKNNESRMCGRYKELYLLESRLLSFMPGTIGLSGACCALVVHDFLTPCFFV